MQVSSKVGLVLVTLFPGTWPPRFTKLWLGMLLTEGSEEQETKQKKRERLNNTSLNSPVNVWVTKFSSTAGNDVGKVQGNRDTRVTCPIFCQKLLQNLAALIHTTECSN